ALSFTSIRERVERAHGPRRRSARARRVGLIELADRRENEPEREYGEVPPAQPVREARRDEPDRGGGALSSAVVAGRRTARTTLAFFPLADPEILVVRFDI